MLLYLAPGWVYQLTALLLTVGRSYHPFSPLPQSSKDDKAVCFSVTLSIRNKPLLAHSCPAFPQEPISLGVRTFLMKDNVNMSVHAIARLPRIYFKIQTIIIILAIIPKNVHGLISVNEIPVNRFLIFKTMRIIITLTQSPSLRTGLSP